MSPNSSSFSRRARLSAVVALSFVAAAVAAACDDSATGGTASTGSGASSTGGSGTGAGSAGTSTGGNAPGCDPACVAPQFCSVTGECIDAGTCNGDADCKDAATVCDLATKTCVPGGGCVDLEANIAPIPPNLLLVLDRSCSMTSTAEPNVTKWQAAVGAINTLTTTYAGKIRFGLTMFPDTVTPNCAQDVIPYPPAPGNEAAIQSTLTSALMPSDPNYPDGPCVTNIDTAMQQAAAAPELTDPDRDSYVALITDGKQAGCNLAGGDTGTTMIISDLFAAGVPTFVVGFGNGVDPTQMDIFANAGGVPNSGPAYYDASNQASLEAVLDTIATKAISCTFTLDQTPPNPDDIHVFFDGVAVDEDVSMTNGWTYDATANEIVFHGSDCDALKNGSVTDIKVILGCAGPG
ncbi:MAG TPA: hypothetical protein VL400_07440 [Polyangiaceae bacterium]|jgi:hypothetical protein|nr:hypothetical protein [Polyangiaceae bacterium]